MKYAKGLQELGNGCYGYLLPDGGWGYSNCGLVVDGQESLLIDTLIDLRLTREMLDVFRRVTPAAAGISTLINTHSNPDHTAGNQLVPGAQIIASTACLEEMQEFAKAPRLDLHGQAAEFFREVLASRFDLSHIPTLPNRTFNGELQLTVGTKRVRVIELGPAHTKGDVIVFVPGDRVVFTGDLVFNGGHPVIWQGPVRNWIGACDVLLSLDVDTVVPGHGPVTGKSAIRAMKEYFQYLGEESLKRYNTGMTFDQAARDIALEGFSGWCDEERIVVNVYACYREFAADSTPFPVASLFGEMARFYYERRSAVSGHAI